jgi:DNA-directed RNA polymerase specialized sigma24 family protein
MSRTVPPAGQQANGEREAFDRALDLPDLLQAAQREVRHRLTLGHFAPDDPTSEQLLDMALQQAWRERARLSPALGVKAQALAAIFRMGEILAARKDERRQKTTELLPEEVEPDPRYEDDVEEFWQSHELDYPRTMRVVNGAADHPRDDAATDDELVGLLDPREREVLLMHEVHGIALPEIVSAVGIPLTEAERLLAGARDRLRAAVEEAR